MAHNLFQERQTDDKPQDKRAFSKQASTRVLVQETRLWLRIAGINLLAMERDRCSFGHDESKRAKPTPKSALHSDPPTEKGGRNTSRRTTLSDQSPSGKLARQPGRDYIKGQ